jgi:hypothetical protein
MAKRRCSEAATARHTAAAAAVPDRGRRSGRPPEFLAARIQQPRPRVRDPSAPARRAAPARPRVSDPGPKACSGNTGDPPQRPGDPAPEELLRGPPSARPWTRTKAAIWGYVPGVQPRTMRHVTTTQRAHATFRQNDVASRLASVLLLARQWPVALPPIRPVPPGIVPASSGPGSRQAPALRTAAPPRGPARPPRGTSPRSPDPPAAAAESSQSSGSPAC